MVACCKSLPNLYAWWQFGANCGRNGVSMFAKTCAGWAGKCKWVMERQRYFFCTRGGSFVRKLCLSCIASLQNPTPVVAFCVAVAKVCLLACKSKHPCFFQAGVLFSTLFLAKFALSFCWMACRQVGQWQGATVRCRAIPQVASWFATVLALAKWHHAL